MTVRLETTTFWQREKRRACGRPCASVGRAAHQMSACPAIVLCTHEASHVMREEQANVDESTYRLTRCSQ